MASPQLILLVEDHDDTREVFTETLRAAGFAVHPTSAFDDGLLVIETVGRVDAVVIDIGLRADGLRFAERVRAASPSLPLIAVTGRMQTGDPREVLFSAYLLKPVFPETLIDVVRQVLARPSTR